MSPEGRNEGRSAAHPTQRETGVVAELSEVLRAEVGQLVVLPVAPEELDGIELGGYAR